MRRVFAILAAVLVLGGCAELLDRISYREMAPRLAYQGFSFERPPNDEWYLRRSEETYTDVTVRRDTGSKTHTAFARVSLAKLDRQPTSHEDFAALLASGDHHEQGVAYTVTEVSRTQTPTTIQNQWCVRLDVEKSIRGAPVAPREELLMRVDGYQCVHPAFPSTMIEFFYSERGLPSEFDPRIAAEGEQFLRGVRIDVAPGIPAGIVATPIPPDLLRP